MPTVSVLLAAQGQAAAADSVRDLLGQSWGDLEIVVLADDGFALEDPLVRVVPVERGGLADALNRGLAVAQGEFVARAVPGDVADAGRLARQVGLMRAAGVAFVGTGWRAIGADGVVERIVSPPAGDAALRAAMAEGDAIGHPTAMMRREAVVQAGGWRPGFVGREDYDLLLRLLDRYAGACTPEAMVDHRGGDAVAGWRALEQGIVSELAAMVAFHRRQVGRPDPGDRLAPADRALLHIMGMADEEITRVLADRASSLAHAAGAAGRWPAMREAARLGLRQPGLSGAAKAQFRALWLRGATHRRPIDPPNPT